MLDKNCHKRYPETCRNGDSCRFHVLQACAYKHSIETLKRKESKDNSVIECLQKDIDSLRNEISQLKNIVMLKEAQIKDKLKDVSNMEKKISVLENENKNLKKHAVESKIVVKVIQTIRTSQIQNLTCLQRIKKILIME